MRARYARTFGHEMGRRGQPWVRPFSFAPIEALVLADVPAVDAQARRTAIVAAQLGVYRRRVQRWRRDGLTWREADMLAVRVGVYPGEVWANWL